MLKNIIVNRIIAIVTLSAADICGLVFGIEYGRDAAMLAVVACICGWILYSVINTLASPTGEKEEQ